MSDARQKVLRAPVREDVPDAAADGAVDHAPPPPLPSTVSPRQGERPILEAGRVRAHQEARSLLEFAEREAHERIEQARAEAKRLREELSAELEQRRHEVEASLDEQLRAARARGRAEGLAEFQSLLVTARDEMRVEAQALRTELVELAVAVGERLFRESLAVRPESIVGTIEEALSALPEIVGELRLYLHPEDRQTVDSLRGQLIELDPRWREIGIFPDVAVGRGGCRIESRAGAVDASLKTQVDALRRQLLELDRRDHKGASHG